MFVLERNFVDSVQLFFSFFFGRRLKKWKIKNTWRFGLGEKEEISSQSEGVKRNVRYVEHSSEFRSIACLRVFNHLRWQLIADHNE